MNVLTKNQQTMLDFCSQWRTTDQIAESIGLKKNSVYHNLDKLQKAGLLEKELIGSHNKRAAFRATGGALQLSEIAEPVESINYDFIRVAHNPFNLMARP